MSSESEISLTASELRSKLFQSLKSKGILQGVQTQLRNQLALELQRKHQQTKPNVKKLPNSLFLKVANSIIVDHMKKCSYDYSLSVFLSETLAENIVSISDVLHFLHINPESKLHKSLIGASTESKEGFLWKFLSVLASSHGQSQRDSSMQTCNPSSTELLDRKLLDVERMQFLKSQKEEEEASQTLEAKVLSYQRKYDAQKKAELHAEMERFRASELSMMRLEEKEKLQKELNVMQAEFEKSYKTKLKRFEQQQEEWKFQIECQKQKFDRDEFEHRQKILTDLQSIKEKECELERKMETAKRTLAVEEDKVKIRGEQLRYKEEFTRQEEDRFESRLKDEVTRLKLEMMESQQNKLQSIQLQEQQLREEKIAFDSQKDMITRWKNEAGKVSEENQNLSAKLLFTKQEIAVLNEKLIDFKQENTKMADYSDLKDETFKLTRENVLLKRDLDVVTQQKSLNEKEHQRMMKELLAKISTPSLDEVNLRKEVENLKDSERQWSVKCEQLNAKFDDAKRKNGKLRQLYEGLLSSQREMFKEMEHLRNALTLANQEKQRLLRSATAYKQELPRSELSNQSVSVAKLLANCEEEDPVNSVLKKLEQEALELENSYKCFQERQKLKSPTSVHFTDLMADAPKFGPKTIANYTGVPSTLNVADLSHFIPTTEQTEPPNVIPNTEVVIMSSVIEPSIVQISPPISTEPISFVDVPTKPLSLADVPTKPLSFVDVPTKPLSSTQAAENISVPSFDFSKVGTHRSDVSIGAHSSKTITCSSPSNKENYSGIFEHTSLKQFPIEKDNLASNDALAASHPLHTGYEIDSHSTDEPLQERNEKLALDNCDVGDRKDSIEHEFALKETSIATFESPLKDEVFATPSAPFRQADVNKHSGDAEQHEGYLQPNDDIMAKYMKMVMDKREKEKEAPDEKFDDDDDDDEDVEMYEEGNIYDSEDKLTLSEKSASDFEW